MDITFRTEVVHVLLLIASSSSVSLLRSDYTCDQITRRFTTKYVTQTKDCLKMIEFCWRHTCLIKSMFQFKIYTECP